MLNKKLKSLIKSRSKKIKNHNILCIGDLILDNYQLGKVNRISPEAPVPILSYQNEKNKMGGVGNVAKNIVSLGGNVTLISLLGNDNASKSINSLIKAEKNIKFKAVKGKRYITPLKSRFIDGTKQLLRVDQEKTNIFLKNDQIKFLNICEREIKRSSLVILSDYNKGVLTNETIKNILILAKKNKKITIVDPKKFDFSIYSGADVITPNIKEFFNAANKNSISDKEIKFIGNDICKTHNINEILLTRSEKGMTLINKTTSKTFSASAKEVFDVTGAGDTVVAVMSLMKSIGFNSKDSVIIAEAAAAYVVSKFGTASIKLNELLK